MKITAIRRYLKKLFFRTSDRRIIDSINIRNLRNMFVFSLAACIMDAFTLALFTAANWDKPGFRQTFINVGCCVIACFIVILLSKAMIRKYNKEGTVSNVKANILVTFFYTVMSAWGIMVDLGHYGAGEQMLTFYIVQFCFVCFVVMLPKIGSLLIALSFSALYIGTYLIDGAVNMQPQNFIIFAIIAILGNVLQHMMLQESEKSKIDILNLNQILWQEASVDDLTKLKNRKALRSDFDKHIGKHVYTIIADIDHFKSYNDTYGHLAGDMVLRKAAAATMEAFHDGDAYRYGGDEFLIILADCTDEDFIESIGKWKEALHSIQIPDVAHSVTCSFGYARRLLKNSDDLRDAIKAADDRLYEAKRKKLQ